MHNRIVRFARRGGFLRRLAILSGGTFIGQGLLVISTPLLTRIYSAEDFGLLVVFSSISAILAMIMALRYEYAIPICGSEEDAAATIGVCLMANFVLTLLFIFLVTLYGQLIANAFGVPSLASLLWLLPVALFLQGLSLPLDYLSLRRTKLRINAMGRILQSAGQVVPQLGLGLIGAGSLGLILGYCFGYLARVLYFLRHLPRSDLKLLRAVRWREMIAMARANWHYPIYSSPSSLLQGSSQLLPAVLLAALYGPAVAGWFGLGQRIVGMPVRLLSQAASQIFLGEASRFDGMARYQLFSDMIICFLLWGVIWMAPLALAGPWLFAFVFGDNWRPAGEMVQLLVPLQLARFVVMPVSQILNITRQQSLHLLSATAANLAMVASFGLGFWFGLSPLGTILLYSFGTTLATLLYLLFAWRAARLSATSMPQP